MNLSGAYLKYFAQLIILYTLYISHISFVLSFSSHPTVILTNLWIEGMYLFIYFHAGVRLWLPFLNLWSPANERKHKKSALVYWGTWLLLKWEGTLRSWNFTSRSRSSFCIGALGDDRMLGSEKVREKKVDSLSTQPKKVVDYLWWIFSLLNFVIYGVYQENISYLWEGWRKFFISEFGGLSKNHSFTNYHTTNKCTNCMSFIFKSLL